MDTTGLTPFKADFAVAATRGGVVAEAAPATRRRRRSGNNSINSHQDKRRVSQRRSTGRYVPLGLPGKGCIQERRNTALAAARCASDFYTVRPERVVQSMGFLVAL